MPSSSKLLDFTDRKPLSFAARPVNGFRDSPRLTCLRRGRGELIAVKLVLLIGGLIFVDVTVGQVGEEWISHYDGTGHCDDRPKAMALDAQGNILVAGDSYGAKMDYAVVKYDSFGNRLWVARYNGPSGGVDELNSMVLDDEGNVYVTGGSVGDESGYPSFDIATLKYDAAGNKVWEQRHQWSDPTQPPQQDDDLGSDKGTSLAIDSTGHLYVTGSVATARNESDVVLLKYAPGGELEWAAYHDGAGHRQDIGNAVVVDASDNVYVAGKSYYDQYHGDPILLKYSADGQLEWMRHHPGDAATAMVLDPAGFLVLMVESGFPGDFITIKYDLEGRLLWASSYDGAGGHDVPHDMTVDRMGNVLVCGRTEHPDSRIDFLTLKYSPDGILLWETRYAGWGQSYDSANAIAVDRAGDVYVTGYTGSLPDFLTIKYDSHGRQLWTARHNGPANGRDHARLIVVLSRRRFFVAGSVQDNPHGDCVDFATIRYTELPTKTTRHK